MSIVNIEKIIENGNQMHNEMNYDMAIVYYERASQICIETAITSLEKLRDSFIELERASDIDFVNKRIEILRNYLKGE